MRQKIWEKFVTKDWINWNDIVIHRSALWWKPDGAAPRDPLFQLSRKREPAQRCCPLVPPEFRKCKIPPRKTAHCLYCLQNFEKCILILWRFRMQTTVCFEFIDIHNRLCPPCSNALISCVYVLLRRAAQRGPYPCLLPLNNVGGVVVVGIFCLFASVAHDKY